MASNKQDRAWRQQKEEALRISEERLRVALELSPGVVWNQDTELRYTWVQSPAEPFTPEQVVGKTDFDLAPRREAERLTEIKRGVLESGVGTRSLVQFTLGSQPHFFDMILEPLRNAEGTVIGITGAAWDVTEQRKIELEQRLLAELGRALIDAAPDYEETLEHLADLVVRHLGDWFVVDVVEEEQVRRLTVACSDPSHRDLAREIESIQLDRTRPHLTSEALASRELLLTEVEPGYLESIAQSPEHLRQLRDMHIRSLVAAPLVARGRLVGAVALISSTRRYHEGDLRLLRELAHLAAPAVDNTQLYRSRQRAIAGRDEVLGIVAHDLRDPLNTILLQTELMRLAGTEPDPRGAQPDEAIRRAALRMKRLIDDMLDVARLEAGTLSVSRCPLSPAELLDEVIAARGAEAAEAGLELRLELEESLPEILADRDRLQQVFDNLLGNAIKFTPSGEVVVAATAGETAVTFRVSDTGPGMASDQVAHIFDRFWQASRTDRRGAGLGMPIVQGIVEAHRGEVWVESELGAGTTVSFTVPRA